MTELVRSMDVSNYQGNLLDEFAAHPEINHVVIRTPLPWEPPSLRTIAIDQIQEAKEAGKSIGAYTWCYRSAGPEDTIDASIDFWMSQDVVLPILWLDEETYNNRHGQVIDPGPDSPWLRRAIERAKNMETPVGHYTAGWWIDGHFPGGFNEFREFRDIPIWLADYRTEQTWDALHSWWTSRGFTFWGWQYRGDPLDLNFFVPEATMVPEPVPPVDPCKALREAVQSELVKIRASLGALEVALNG